MSSLSKPQWYEPGDVVQTIRNARADKDVSQSDLIAVLTIYEFDVPQARVEELVAATPEDVATSDATDPVNLADTRDVDTRFVDGTDVAYLSTAEFAMVTGAALARYAGNFRILTDMDDVVVDLLWNRQHTTTAFRTVPLPTDQSVEVEVVESVAKGPTSPPSSRSPSVVAILTNSDYTDAAQDAAAGTDIELFGSDRLEQWLRDAKLTPEIVGELIDEGERSEAEIEGLLATLPAMPDSLKSVDPLTDTKGSGRVALSPGSKGSSDGNSPKRSRSIPVVETPTDPGQRGELYADPDKDGDYTAVNDFIDNLDQEDDST